MGFLRRARIHAWRGWEPEKKQRQLDVPKHLKEVIPESKLELLHKHFQTFDEDGNGLLDTKQLGKFLRSIGFNPPESRVEEIITEYDKDGNGNLSFGEFVELWHSYCQEAVNEQDVISRAFEFFDQDDSKAISFSEFKSIMTEAGDPLSHEELDCFFKLVDSNQDGMLNFQEFVGGVLYKENVVGGRDLTQVQ